MKEIWLVLSVVGLFLLRIGVPLLLLMLVGVFIERWQTRREEEVRQYYAREHEDQLPQGSV